MTKLEFEPRWSALDGMLFWLLRTAGNLRSRIEIGERLGERDLGVFEAVFESVIQVAEIYKGGSIKQFNCGSWIELWVRSPYRGQE